MTLNISKKLMDNLCGWSGDREDFGFINKEGAISIGSSGASKYVEVHGDQNHHQQLRHYQ